MIKITNLEKIYRTEEVETIALNKLTFDVKEGEASVFKPEGGKYTLVGKLQMEDWPKLAEVMK